MMLAVAAFLGEVGAARRGHPAQDLGRGEVLGLTADLPDPLVGFAPVLQGGVNEPGEPFPHRRDDLGGPAAELDVDGVEDHSPHVVLVLVPGAVADPNRARSPIPGQVAESPFGQVAFPADAVHDLQLWHAVKVAASDGSSAPNTLGESGRGRHSHSTAPFGATRQLCSQLDKSP